jgi:hypothetical protein
MNIRHQNIKISIYDNFQKLTLGIIRSDYMLDQSKFEKNDGSRLSQIEINTFACGGCATPGKVNELHRYMLQKTYNYDYLDKVES